MFFYSKDFEFLINLFGVLFYSQQLELQVANTRDYKQGPNQRQLRAGYSLLMAEKYKVNLKASEDRTNNTFTYKIFKKYLEICACAAAYTITII